MTPSLRPLSILPLLALAVPAQPDAKAAEKHQLAVHAAPGAKAAFRIEQSQRQTIPLMDRETEMRLTSDHDVEVLRASANGSLTVKVTWRRFQGKLANPMGGDVEFDTSVKDPGNDDPMLGGVVDAFLALDGKSVEVTIGPDGEVADRQPIKTLVESALENAEGMGRMVAQGLLSETALRQQIEVFGSFPKEPVSVGGTWKRSDKMGGRGGLTMKSDVTAKLAMLDADAMRTTFEGTIGIDPAKQGAGEEAGSDEEAMHQAMMRDAKIENGKVVGEATVARKDGMLRESTTKVSMEISMPNPMGGEEPLVVKVEQQTKLARRDADAKDTPKGAGPGK